MESFEPLINLLVVLTVLSVAAERITELLKLRDSDLRDRKLAIAKGEEKERAYKISLRATLIGMILALGVKADFFEILTHLEDPWATFGWVQVKEHQWFKAPATRGVGNFIYALSGCVLTGIALGFGSKFWHDVLGAVYELRSIARNRNERAELQIAQAKEDNPDA